LHVEPAAEEPAGREPQAYAFGQFRLIPGERALRRGDRDLTLPPKAFHTRLLLADNAGHLMRKDDLLRALWPNTFVEEVNLANKISLLRKTLGDARYIQTVAKRGYRFTPAVTRVWSTGATQAGAARAAVPARPERVTRCQAQRESVFEIQDNLARRTIELLLPRLSEREVCEVTRDVPGSARAYEFYLRATHVERERSFENMCVARDLYRQCVDADPDYAPAWARLGRCYRFLQKFQPEGGALPESAEWAFRRAFALNPELPVAHHHYTHIEADAGRAQAAMVRLLRQAERRPNDPELFGGLVQATRYCGLLEASLRAHDRAWSLDPNAVTSVAHTHFLLGDYERTLALYPPGNRFYLDAAALALMGGESEGLALIRQRTLLAPLVESLRLTLEGDGAASTAVIRRALEELRGRDPEMRFYLARRLVRNGAADDALRTIRQLADEGFCCSTALCRDAWLRPLAAETGYAEVVAAVEGREAEARAAFEEANGAAVLG
jgi:DNA-binding winged helix-turn-helix (wHTH) protein